MLEDKIKANEERSRESLLNRETFALKKTDEVIESLEWEIIALKQHQIYKRREIKDFIQKSWTSMHKNLDLKIKEDKEWLKRICPESSLVTD